MGMADGGWVLATVLADVADVADTDVRLGVFVVWRIVADVADVWLSRRLADGRSDKTWIPTLSNIFFGLIGALKPEPIAYGFFLHSFLKCLFFAL